jgi:hypothetical protein
MRKLQSLLTTGSGLRSFECHATICRIETTHASRAEYEAFARGEVGGLSEGFGLTPVIVTISSRFGSETSGHRVSSLDDRDTSGRRTDRRNLKRGKLVRPEASSALRALGKEGKPHARRDDRVARERGSS